jgi:predicted  nucleic acid-binding Zn-ribbon protein|tara:strand:- start:650 stop:862 length:213 start_codon:yes stop_codon:yes gene_type:complete
MSNELAEAKQLIKTLQGQVNSLQYTKHHDYKFLVEENKRLTGELDEVKRDNKKLTQQINEMVAKLRDANF